MNNKKTKIPFLPQLTFSVSLIEYGPKKQLWLLTNSMKHNSLLVRLGKTVCTVYKKYFIKLKPVIPQLFPSPNW